MQKVTMYDVARKAGVSQAAVSKILSGKDPWVSDLTRRRVHDAARELGYRRNYHARLLRTGRTQCLGLMGNLQGFALDNYLYTRISRGIEDELFDSKSPYSLLLFGANWGAGYEKSLTLIERGLVDGLIWILLAAYIQEFERQVAPWLAERGIPFVVVHSLGRRAFDFPNVGFDSFEGGRLAARHLLRLKHERIGLYLVSRENPQSAEILAGFRQALEESGRPWDERLLVRDVPGAAGPKANLFERAYATAKALPREEIPPALLVGLDASAYGFVRGFRERGLRVPEDVAVVGFDDEIVSRYVESELSTVHHPFLEKGREAVRMLTKILDRPQNGEAPPRKILRPTLVVRRTCGGKE